MDTKQVVNAVRLLVGEAEARAAGTEIAPEFIPKITEARTEIALTRGIDVVEALTVINRSGLRMSMDVRLRTRIMDKEQSQRPARR